MVTTQADADNFAESETVKLLKDEIAWQTADRARLLQWVEDLQAGQTCCTKCGWNFGQTDRPVVGAYKDCPLGPHRGDDTDGTPA